jgi:myosin heavy subunit
MYCRLFGWLVKSLNNKLTPDQASQKSQSQSVFSIGPLDMFGSENLIKGKNSLEKHITLHRTFWLQFLTKFKK